MWMILCLISVEGTKKFNVSMTFKFINLVLQCTQLISRRKIIQKNNMNDDIEKLLGVILEFFL